MTTDQLFGLIMALGIWAALICFAVIIGCDSIALLTALSAQEVES